MGYGFVYVARNRSMPGLYKIGSTQGSPTERLKQLSAATGVPCGFDLMAYCEVDRPQWVESEFHAVFRCVRENNRREFFRLSKIHQSSLLATMEDIGISYWENSPMCYEEQARSLIVEVNIQ